MASRQKNAHVLPMARNLSYRVSILHALIGKQTTSIYQSRDLTSHQWKVMSVLYSWPPMPASRITEMVTLDKAAISRAVVGLVKLKLANRKRDLPTGTINVILTDAGRSLYHDMMLEMYDIQQRIFAGLRADEMRALFSTFDKIEASLRAMLTRQETSAGRETRSSRQPFKAARQAKAPARSNAAAKDAATS